jgi:RNA recognition motif-containing protein
MRFNTINLFKLSSVCQKTFYLGNLPWKISEKELKNELEKLTTSHLKMVRLPKNEYGRGLGYGFLDANVEEGEASNKLIEELNGASVDGRELKISVSNRGWESKIPYRTNKNGNNSKDKKSKRPNWKKIEADRNKLIEHFNKQY